jgi:hypothetical protein
MLSSTIADESRAKAVNFHSGSRTGGKKPAEIQEKPGINRFNAPGVY